MCKLPKNSCVLQCSVQFNGCYHSQVPKFSQNLFLLLTLSFCQFNMIAKASFVRPTFASSLTDLFFAVLDFLNQSTEFSVVHLYMQPNRITGIYRYLIRKMLGSQSRTTMYNIPAKVILVDYPYIHFVGLSIKRGYIYFQLKHKTSIPPPILVLVFPRIF